MVAMADPLDRYREMRDFEATPEPAGEAPAADVEGVRFVVQEHHATSMHWDLRLERDGVLASWAVPKGIPVDPRQNHLAVHTEDHPLEYLDFHGDIPDGSYGAGQMTVWDGGSYECHEWEPNKVVVTLHGRRARGRYALFQTRDNQWIIHRMDPPEDPTREAMPSGLRPMTASAGALPDDEDAFGFEVRWSGVRALGSIEGGRIRVEDAGGADIGGTFPEIRPLGRAVGATEVILDGVVVAAGDGGRPDAERMARRVAARSDSVVRRLARAIPVVYMVFDVLWHEGHPTLELAYDDRRRLLDELRLEGPAWQVPASHPGQGAALLEASAAMGLDGIVAKRRTARYTPGAASPDWIEVLR
jgi:bifunctional non-homologous end joining protein LigD